MYPQTIPYLAFDEIDTKSLYTLALADISYYPPGLSIINQTYQILPPGFPAVTLMYTQSSIDIFNSNNLNITCVDNHSALSTLPDGIWRVRQSINPVQSYLNEKTFIRVTKLKHDFGQAFLKTDMINCDANVGSEAMSYLMQINAYIEGAIAASNQCNLVLAMDLYRLADRTLKNFLKGNIQGIPTRTSWY